MKRLIRPIRLLAFGSALSMGTTCGALWCEPEPQVARVTGRVTAGAADGFEIQPGRRQETADATRPGVDSRTRVITGPETRVLEARKGAPSDLKPGYLVSVIGQIQPDGKLAARDIVRLWPVEGEGSETGALTRAHEQMALAAAKGARGVLRGDSEKKQRISGVLAPLIRPPSRKPAPERGAPQAARKEAPPILGRIVSTAPLRIAQGGQPVEVVAAAECDVAVMQPLGIKDLKVGDGVMVLGPVAAAAAHGEPGRMQAQLVLKSPGGRSERSKSNRAQRAGVRLDRANRRR